MEQEAEIELHLAEQRQQLEVIQQALEQEPEDQELLELQKELETSIEEFSQALLDIKKAVLLESIHQVERDKEIKEIQETYRPGIICRFKHSNNRWYSCEVENVLENGQIQVKALYPTSHAMLKIRPLDNKNLIVIDDSSIAQDDIQVGSVVYAKNYYTQLWEKAEVNVMDSNTQRIQVIYQKSGRRKWLDKTNVRESLRDQGSSLPSGGDDADKFSQSEGCNEKNYTTGGDSEDYDDENESDQVDKQDDQQDESEDDADDSEFHGGLGAVKFGSFKALTASDEEDTIRSDQSSFKRDPNQQLFADWEWHGKGIASKLMQKMGYEFGKGLGANKQGRIEPVNAIMLPKNKGLGTAKPGELKKKTKKSSRGGERARRKRRRLAAQALNDEETDRILEMEKDSGQVGVFAILDAAMAKHGAENQSIKQQQQQLQKQSSNSGSYFSDKSGRRLVPQDRKTLLAHQNKVGNLKEEIAKMEQIASKNVNHKEIYIDIIQKVGNLKKKLSKAEQEVASIEKAVNNQERRQEAFRF